jgi:hypothetical protein
MGGGGGATVVAIVNGKFGLGKVEASSTRIYGNLVVLLGAASSLLLVLSSPAAAGNKGDANDECILAQKAVCGCVDSEQEAFSFRQIFRHDRGTTQLISGYSMRQNHP